MSARMTDEQLRAARLSLTNRDGFAIGRSNLIEMVNELLDLREQNVWMTGERQRVREALGIHGSEIQAPVAIRILKEKACAHCECPEAHQ